MKSQSHDLGFIVIILYVEFLFGQNTYDLNWVAKMNITLISRYYLWSCMCL